MKEKYTIERLMGTPEKRARLARIIYIISYVMLLLGFVLIILSFIYPDLLR